MQLNLSRRWAPAPGFTLVEVLVAMVLILMLTGTIFTAYRYQMFAIKGQETQLDVQEAARSLIDLLTREVRLAGYDPTCAKSFAAIANAQPQSLQLQFDSSEDGAIGSGENITYAYDATLGEIQRTAGGTPIALFSDLPASALAFTYYDGSGAVLTPSGSPAALTAAQRTAIRRVRVAVSIQRPHPDPGNSSIILSNFASNVDLRNRFLNGSVACP
jgi:type IV pilus assembly protein PilW